MLRIHGGMGVEFNRLSLIATRTTLFGDTDSLANFLAQSRPHALKRAHRAIAAPDLRP